MKYKNRKFLATAVVTSTALVTGIGAIPANASPLPTIATPQVTQAATVTPFVIGWKDVLMAAFEYILNNVSSPVKHPATFSDNGSRATATPGSVKFNDGNNGVNTVDKKVYAQKAGHRIEMWANSQMFLYRGSIGVVLRKGTFKPINRTVGHNQYSTYKIASGKTGNYIASFNSTSKHKWRVWVAYNHYGTKSFQALNNGDNTQPVDFTDIDGRKFLVPSESFASTPSIARQFMGPKEEFTFEEIYEEFYDEAQDSLVDVPKSLSPDQSIVITDNISDLSYDAKNDATYFYFNDARTPIELPFKGDLTGKFTRGDKVKFKFKMNRVNDDYDFVSFDYSDAISMTGEFPDISDFLVN